MNCEQALIALSAELDGELSPDARAALDDHLAHCPACRALRKDLAALHDAWDGMDVEAPDELMKNVLGHLPPQEPVKKAPVLRLQWKRWAGVAAGLVLVVAAAWALSHAVSTPTVDGAPEVAAYGGTTTGVTEDATTDEAAPQDATPRMMTKTTGAEAPAETPEYVEGEAVSANAAPSSPTSSPEKYVAQGTSDSTQGVQPLSGNESDAAPPEEVEVGGTSSVYLGTLTLPAIPDGDIVLSLPHFLREDGAWCYELSAQDFQDFIARLDEAQAEYELETSDPSAELGLVIVTDP